MELKQNNIGNGFNRLVNQLAADKKKTLVASCLIAVMVFMWAKVMSGKGPKSAEAASSYRQAHEQQGPESKVSFVEMPSVKGRNDVLTRDFFKVNGEVFGNTEEVNMISKTSEGDISVIVEKLKLEAIELGRNPQAFINNKLLSVGDSLLVRDGSNTYECEVVSIEKNTVLIRCLEAEITLKFKSINVAD